MVINLLYLMVGCIIGILVKFEMDVREKKARLKTKMSRWQENAWKKERELQKCEDVLLSLRGINENLRLIQQQEKEVR